MATRVTSSRPKVTRVVTGHPHTIRAQEIVVSVLWTPLGGMIELRALKHRGRLTIMVDRLFDQLAWREARAAVAKRNKKR
jgi:hypothetical protein